MITLPPTTFARRIGASWALVSQEKTYNPIQGTQVVTVYEGDANGIESLILTLAYYERFEISSPDAPVVKLTVYSPDPAEAPVWELLCNFKEKDLFEHPKAKGISQHDIKVIQAFLKKPLADSDPAVTGLGTGGVDLALKFYKLLLEGTKKYAVEDYVIRYTVTASNQFQLNLAYGNIDKLFTMDQLKTVGVSGLVLPAGIIASIAQISTPAGGVPVDHLWSWLKRAPTARQTQIGKVVISGEWWLQAWSTFIYDIV